MGTYSEAMGSIVFGNRTMRQCINVAARPHARERRLPAWRRPGGLTEQHRRGEKKSCSLHSSIHETARGSIFSSFETVQLTTDERLYLHAARLGEIALLRELVEEEETYSKLNVNCVDYMGRNALFLAVDTENVEAIELLLDRVSWECIEESLLHAISLGVRNLVRIIIDHPSYMTGEKATIKNPTSCKDPFFRTEEKYQYPPDITPLILAAHMNDHELIQLFLSRGHSIDRPHAINCSCRNCQLKQNSDSLKRSISRLNAYKALANPAYMALSYPDPITTTFELRQEMKSVAHVEKEFQNEYLSLVEQCMNFACELMDLCRGTQEVEAVLGEESSESHDPLARLRLAIEYGEKKFVAHPNCQQHLTNIWYGKSMGFLQTMGLFRKVLFGAAAMPCLPFLCIYYIINPNTKFGVALRCPVSKFITHTASHFVFLFLLALATFGLEDVFYGLEMPPGVLDNDTTFELRMLSRLRPMRTSITTVQYTIIAWVIGLLWIECKQIYHAGVREHFIQYCNYMDFSLIALYLASYALRFVAQFRVAEADHYFNVTMRITEASRMHNYTVFYNLLNESRDPRNYPYGYFLQASRFYWSPEDPEIVSDVLFAMANLISFARTTTIMPSHELLGPLQISLGRMVGDIMRFLVLFFLVLVAFMVGMTNLYRYYGSHINEEDQTPASSTFTGLPETVHTLFFSIFGLVALDKLIIKKPNATDALGLPNADSTMLVDRVGLVMFAFYLVVSSIVLVNILIAMMSHSFDAVQGDNDVEWKFARTKLWMNYIDENGTLPVPFNMLITPKTFRAVYRSMRKALIRKGFWCDDDISATIDYDLTKRRENNVLPDPEVVRKLIKRSTTYTEIMQRLVRRYLFKQERRRKEDIRVANVTEEYEDGSEETAGGANTQNAVPDEVGEKRGSIQSSIPEEHEYDNVSAASTVLNIIGPDEEPVSPQYSYSYNEPIDRPNPNQSRASSLHLPPAFPDPAGLPRSASAEALRQITRRATLKRTGTRRTSRRVREKNYDAQLDAIQRAQKVLNARLQDLQISRSGDDFVRENVEHMRHLMGINQRAMNSLVVAMETIQDEIRNLALHISAIRRSPSSVSKSSQGRLKKPSLKKRRSSPIENV